ncbi:hypothetical protein BAY61_20290 [Prauserella marina]|uniref:Uncharacterized protein n=1 Tax=Prauserella marina TaxID=530584 RepID=A0A222VSP8_9PSEU|nr:hypothetical protein [Prauserella marina]ASR36934.1 hypothetical protein BAY61_20290 [Prauserella marina]PWV80114.1 hypothetical protein DES30_103204 [Prauserella marina]SDD82914.1 hypothetical protein SAMN05421630_11313 [Prauserella marina]
MLGSALRMPGQALAAARRAGHSARAAINALPVISGLLGELKETAKQLERLSTFATQELPEIVYQLEAIRGQLTAIEKRLSARNTDVTPASPRTGSPRPS